MLHGAHLLALAALAAVAGFAAGLGWVLNRDLRAARRCRGGQK